ncbi:LytR family transcriptional regulator [Streptomyces sp. 130]|uniref:LCP family protein n=1 Tax=Streptomyces sp. 130 TaxID=2591006 RepID=UPI00117C69EF|nr:LCP family protein [Streptomyces sp. 130]TRV76854.1 LytR family transcriptional regulator [Streptomyces sp. 130]
MSHDAVPTSTPESRPTSHGGRGKRREGRKRRRGLKITLSVLLVLLLAAGGTVWWLYSHLNGNIKGVDINKALGEDRPEKLPTSGQNLLVLGSDSRAGSENKELGGGAGVSGARSDTALVVHIPEGRQKAVAVSIPRDTLVTRPECTKADGSTLAAKDRVMFNSVYSLVGPACVVKTVEKMSGVRIDHYLEINFAGFKGLVDAIGGVNIDVKEPIHDKKTGLDVEAGPHKFDGTESLKFVRTRYSLSDGTDLSRIGLQQQFLMALLKEVKSQDLLGSPTSAYKIANSATAALTTDEELASLTSLAKFARSMNGVDPDTMETIMLPVEYDKIDHNRVVAVKSRSDALWKAIREDAPIPESAKKSPALGQG